MCFLLIAWLLRGRLCACKPVYPHQLGDCCYSTDRPKSVRNRCIIQVFGSVFYVVMLFLYARLQTGRIMVWWCPSDSPSVRLSVCPSIRLSRSSSVRPFSALFSYLLWHIELKFCKWLCFDVLQIKFDCRHFASIFEGVTLFVNLEYR